MLCIDFIDFSQSSCVCVRGGVERAGVGGVVVVMLCCVVSCCVVLDERVAGKC